MEGIQEKLELRWKTIYYKHRTNEDEQDDVKYEQRTRHHQSEIRIMRLRAMKSAITRYHQFETNQTKTLTKHQLQRVTIHLRLLIKIKERNFNHEIRYTKIPAAQDY